MLLKLVPANTNIAFVNKRKIAYGVSLLLMIASLFLFFNRGLNYGIDFEGGILIEIKTAQPADISAIRKTLGALDMGDVAVQEFGEPDEVLIRLQIQDGMKQDDVVVKVREALNAAIGDDISYRRTETVGAKVSGELIEDGITSILMAVLAVLVYIWFRFEWQFGLGAVLALVHDVTLTIGLFSLLQLEFNLSIIAAILTIVGYSLNDTVVVYDRIRENLRKFRKKAMPELLNLSINETLSRTMMTSLTTLLALLSLFYFGGEVVRGFTAAMIWGVFVGTYSSIFIASPVLLWFELRREPDSMPEDGMEILPPKK